MATLFDKLTTMGVDAVTGLGDHLQDTEKLGQIGLSPQDYNVISAMNAAENMNAGLPSLVGPAALYSIGDTISNTNQGLVEGVKDFGRYMKGVNIQSNPELAKQLMGQNYVNQMQGKYALAMDAIGKGIFGKGPNPDLYNRSTPKNLGFIEEAPQIKEAVGIIDRNRGQMPVDTRVSPEFTRPNMSDIAGLGDLGNPTGDARVVSEEQGLSGGFVPTNRPNMRDIAGDINLNMTDLGNPTGDSRVVSEEQGLVGGIPDRNRGMPGARTGAYEMIGGTPVAIGDVLGRQQALEKADFYEAPQQGINFDALGILGTLGGLLTGSTALRGLGLGANIASGKMGRALDGISRGLGSFAGKMRGINPVTGRPNTQREYEQARIGRRQQKRTDRMIDRITSGKRTSKDPRSAGTTKAQKDAISAAIQESRRAGQYTDKDSSGTGGSGTGKIVCTMMNERYGFGSFRNKIWMKFHENHGPEYQKGYHAIFLPLVKIAKGEGKINTAVRKVLEHMGRHVTADMFKIMKGKKRDTLGRIYRAIFEPACHIIGKIKSVLGRG